MPQKITHHWHLVFFPIILMRVISHLLFVALSLLFWKMKRDDFQVPIYFNLTINLSLISLFSYSSSLKIYFYRYITTQAEANWWITGLIIRGCDTNNWHFFSYVKIVFLHIVIRSFELSRLFTSAERFELCHYHFSCDLPSS